MDEMNNTMMNEVNETEATTDMVPSETETVVTSEGSTDSGESSSTASAAIVVGVFALAGYGAFTLGKKIAGKVVPVVKDKISKHKKAKEEPSEPVGIEVEAKEVETENEPNEK